MGYGELIICHIFKTNMYQCNCIVLLDSLLVSFSGSISV